MNTPRTNEALAALLERDGELSEENAPEVLVKLCKELETEAGQLREQVERSQAGATVWHRRCFGEDPKWGDTKDAIVGKAVALVKFWEEQGGGNGVMARAKEDALILACGSLHNVKAHPRAHKPQNLNKKLVARWVSRLVRNLLSLWRIWCGSWNSESVTT